MNFFGLQFAIAAFIYAFVASGSPMNFAGPSNSEFGGMRREHAAEVEMGVTAKDFVETLKASTIDNLLENQLAIPAEWRYENWCKAVIAEMHPDLQSQLINYYAGKEQWDKVQFMLFNGAKHELLEYSMKRAKLHEKQTAVNQLLEFGVADVPLAEVDMAKLKIFFDTKAEIMESVGMQWPPRSSKSVDMDMMLLIAADSGSYDAVKYLLDHGADVFFIYKSEVTLLHVAAQISLGVVKQLIIAGSDVNAQDNGKKTPLHRAADSVFEEIVDELLAAGADVNAVDSYEGWTPLHTAVENSRKVCTKIVQRLLDAGADAGAKDRRGNTPLQLAHRNKDLELIRLLEKALTTESIKQAGKTDGVSHSEECSICFDPLTFGVHSLNCGHSFHQSCIQRVENKKCPLCRQEFEL